MAFTSSSKLLKEYVSVFMSLGGDWKVVKHSFEHLFHPDLRVATEGGELPFSAWMLTHKTLLELGGTVSAEDIEEVADGLTYVLQAKMSDGLVVHQKVHAIFKDGKVFRLEFADPTQVQKLVDEMKSKLENYTKVIRLLKEYCSKFDGSATSWTNVKPLAEQLYHPDFRFVTDKGRIDYNTWMKLLEKFTGVGGIVQLEGEIKVTLEGLIFNLLCTTFPEGRLEKDGPNKATIKDGRIIQIEPTDKEAFGKKLGKFAEMYTKAEDDPVVKTFIEYFTKVDGSAEAWSNAKPLLEQVLHPSVKFVTDEGEHGYGFLFNTVKTMIASGGIAKLDMISPRRGDGVVEYVVSNIHRDGKIDQIEQWALIQNEKIVRIEAKKPAEFGRLVENIQANSTPIFKLIEEYFSKFNGSSKAWLNVKPLIEKVYHRDAVLVFDNGEMKIKDFYQAVEKFCNGGGTITLEELYRVSDDSARMVLTLVLPDGNVLSRQERKATLKDGKVVQLEPANPKEFRNLVEEMMAADKSTNPVAEEQAEED